MFAKLRKVNQACKSNWHAIDKEKINVKFESVLAGILNNSCAGVSASFADKENNKRILNASARQDIVSADSADTKNIKISLEELIARV